MISILFIVMILMAFFAKSVQEDTPHIEELQQQIIRLTQENEELRAQVIAFKEELEVRIDQEDRITALRADNKRLREDLAKFELEVARLKIEIADLGIENENLGAKIEDLNKRIAELELELEELKKRSEEDPLETALRAFQRIAMSCSALSKRGLFRLESR